MDRFWIQNAAAITDSIDRNLEVIKSRLLRFQNQYYNRHYSIMLKAE